MDTTLVQCSICCLERPAVELCTCNAMEDKRICEKCAVQLYEGCADTKCNCYGFRCAFCRALDKTPKAWTNSSALYWKRRATDLAGRLEDCATVLTRMADQVVDLQEQRQDLKRQLNEIPRGLHSFMSQ